MDDYIRHLKSLDSLRNQLEHAPSHRRAAIKTEIGHLEAWHQLQIEAEVDDPNAPNSVNNATDWNQNHK